MNETTQLDLLVRLAWIVFGCIATLSLAFTVVGGIAFWRAGKGQAKSFTLLFERAQALRISAVVLIILAVVLLGLIGKIDPSGIVAILSGVAGYVLGGLDKVSRPAEPAGAGNDEG